MVIYHGLARRYLPAPGFLMRPELNSGTLARARDGQARPARAILSGVSQRELQVFTSFEAADRADDDYYASLSPDERLDVLLTLIAAYREATGEAATRLERVYRVTELSRV